MKFNYLTIAIFFLTSTTLQAQLVNIEGKRMQTDSIRFVLKNNFSFSYYNNDGTLTYQISNVLTTQVKSKDLKKIYFLIGNYNVVNTSDKDLRNSWFLHARFNYKLTNLFRLEAYIQSQNNKLLDVNSRNLVGAGIRFKLISKENVKFYLGNSYMYEEEKSDEFNKYFYNNRNSSYFSLTAYIPKSKISILNTFYYQPLYSNFDDYRILEQFKVELTLSKHLSFFTLFNYYFDSITPKDRKQYSSNLKLGLGLKL